MRSILLAAFLALALLPLSASAKAWQGITPGVSTIDEVVNTPLPKRTQEVPT